MLLFDHLLIYINYVKTGDGPEDVIAEAQKSDNIHFSFVSDLKNIFTRELRFLVVFGIVSIGSWIISSIDILIFGEQTFSGLVLVFSPLFIVETLLPQAVNGLLGFVLGPPICYCLYVILLCLKRKVWFGKWKKQNKHTSQR